MISYTNSKRGSNGQMEKGIILLWERFLQVAFNRSYCCGIPTKYPALRRADSRLLQGSESTVRHARPACTDRELKGLGPRQLLYPMRTIYLYNYIPLLLSRSYLMLVKICTCLVAGIHTVYIGRWGVFRFLMPVRLQPCGLTRLCWCWRTVWSQRTWSRV